MKKETVVPLTEIHVAEERQRKFFDEAAAAELRESIMSSIGLLNPLFVVPREEGGYRLIAGERRLRALREITKSYHHGDTVIPAGYAPVVVHSSLSELEQLEAELVENTVRVNLQWQEKAAAIARLHEFRKAINPKHTAGDTARLVNTSENPGDAGYSGGTKTLVNQALLLAPYLENPTVAKAGSMREAVAIVTKQLEQQMTEIWLENQNAVAAAAAVSDIFDDEEDTSEAITTAAEVDSIFSQIVGAPVKVKNDFTLLEGDFEETVQTIADGSVQIVLTDPPYCINAQTFKGGNAPNVVHGYDDSKELGMLLFPKLAEEFTRVCTESAHIYWFCDPEWYYYIGNQLQMRDWKVRRKPIIWKRGTAATLSSGSANGYRSNYEVILFAERGNRVCSGIENDVLVFQPDALTLHAAQKPVALYELLLRMSAVPGDTIYDPFAGSGTIFRATQKKPYKIIGGEMNPSYIAQCRLAMDGHTFTDDDIPF